jgi:hypothetical protein
MAVTEIPLINETDPQRQRLLDRVLYGQRQMQEGSSTAPVQHWTQGLARMLQAGIGGYVAGEARRDDEALVRNRNKLTAEALRSGDPIAALSQSEDPYLSGMGSRAALTKALRGEEAPELVQAVGPDGRMTWVPKSQAAGMGSALPKGPEAAPTRERGDGRGNIIQEEMAPDGSWRPIGSKPQFAPQQVPGPTERERNALAAGLQRGTPEYQRYILDQEEGGGPFTGNAMDAQASNILLTGDPASPAYAAAHAHLSQPRVNFDPNTGKMVTVSPDLSWAKPPAGGSPGAQQQPNIRGMTPRPDGMETLQVPGATITSTAGGAKMSPEEATKYTALDEGSRDIENAIGVLAPEGKVNEMGVVSGQSFLGAGGVPFTEGRQARQQMQRGIEAILRAMTGAAAPESEVDRYMGMFFPSPTDSDAAAVEKLETARRWVDGIKGQMRVGRPQLQGGGEIPPPPPGFVPLVRQ